ncbi:MAG: carboxypeptidase regulatory-like domain-containing protein [Gemmatimonadaceae bacterium]|nr:carboxypeptidase regulatory-like domain-containing protein [Gemmatimonadaceae bacterium]
MRRILLALTVAATPTLARSQVFQVQGGGSSLFAGYGGMLNVWGNGYEASLGVGYLDGLRIGVAGRRLIGGRDTLRAGNDLLPFTFDTDVFGTGGSLFAQGLSIQRRRGRTQSWIFAGASANALAAPYFGAQRAVRAMGWARVRHDVSRALSVSGHAVLTDRQSLFGSARWRPVHGVDGSMTLGVGSNAPYAALGLDVARERLDVRAALVGMGAGFRRASGPMPLQTELEHANALVTWKPADGWAVGVGRQHFRQDSSFAALPQRASLTQLTTTGRFAGVAFSGGWLRSEADRRSNLSSYFTARRQLTGWLQGETYLLRVWEPRPARSTTPVLLLRETLSPRLSLLQVITHERGRSNISFGGTLASGLNTIGLDYQLAHSPYLTGDPFVHSMGVNARVHVRGVSLALSSFVTPDGRVHYSAQGNTFLYRGMDGGPAAPSGGRIDAFVASGRVVDTTGAPIEGAALEVGSDVVYTDSQGRFFVRQPTGRDLTLRVLLDDFLAPGKFEVVSAPAALRPSKDGRATPALIVVRKVVGR